METQSDDAARKIELLQTEVAFNGSLVSTLQNIQAVRELLESAQSAGLGGNLLESVSLIGQAQVKLDQLEGCGNTTLVDLIRVKIADIRNTTAKTLTESWNNLVHVNVEESSITINQEDQRLTLRTVVDGLDTLDLLKDKIIVFQKTFDKLIITPRLSPPSDSSVSYIVFDKDTTRISHPQSSTKSTRIFTDITSTLEFLSSRLPEAFYVPFSALWIPILASKLISGPLPAAVSTDLSELKEFQDMLEEVKIFSASIQRLCPRASQELNSWVQNAPNVWLDRRSEYSLNGIRRTLKRGLGKSRAVERVETQVLTREENAFAGPTGNDDWDASWSDNDDNGQDDEEEKNTQDLETAQKRTTESNEHNDDEDSGGWGFEEEEETENDTRQEEHQKEEPDDGGDAWGWSDEDDKPNDGPSQSKQPSPSKAQTVQNNGHPLAKSSEQREVTLIETYHISALPEQILEIIVQDVEDADTLAVSKYELLQQFRVF